MFSPCNFFVSGIVNLLNVKKNSHGVFSLNES